MDSHWLAVLAVIVTAAVVVALCGRQILRTRPGTGVSSGASADPHASSESMMGVELGSEIRCALERVEAHASVEHVRFSLAVEPHLRALADPEALRQALTDLLDHAISRTPSGSVLVAARRERGGVRVTVSDDGPFGDETGVRTALLPVIELLASQGGRLEIDSRPGEGMTVAMQLPGSCATQPGGVAFAHA